VSAGAEDEDGTDDNNGLMLGDEDKDRGIDG